MRIAKVFVNLSLDRGFDYLIPERLANDVQVGSQVVVPFGKQHRLGFVTAIGNHSKYDDLKEIESLGGNQTSLPPKLLELAKWMALYYCSAHEQAVRTLLPGVVRRGKMRDKTVKKFDLAEPQPEGAVKSEKQRRVLAVLRTEGALPLNTLTLLADCGAGVVKSLEKSGHVVFTEERTLRSPFSETVIPDLPRQLNPAQAAALATFQKMAAGEVAQKVMLLFGATNSGKTEVYLHAIAKTIEQGKQAVVLVPEIALTPQTVRRFRARFGERVSVMHSRLSEAERFDQWNRIRRGEADIAVGARSALFAPFDRLGLIVVDEEHESSYKQAEAPRYHARDVAVMRAHLEGACVILGSATPAMESYHNAMIGKYLLCEMPDTAGTAVPPEIKVVDLRLTLKAAGSAEEQDGGLSASLFSPMLVNAVRERLSMGQQSLIFRNLRGYSRELRCEKCGFVPGCPDCSVSFAYHKRDAVMLCHLCGLTIPAPTKCLQCGDDGIRHPGSGTEKIEAMAHVLFPNARIERMDSDSMRGVDAHEKLLNRIQRNEVDIIIGTQMIAKGLHFPNITLAAVINADHGLFIEDFRAAERTYALLTQVAGRAGRGELSGEVLVQTFSPHNEAITLALANDFKRFYEFEREVRELFGYPPFGHVLILHLRGEDQELVRRTAEECHAELMPYFHDRVKAAPAVPAPVERIKGKYRYMIAIRGEGLKNIRAKLRELALRRHANGKVELYVDVDPQSFM